MLFWWDRIGKVMKMKAIRSWNIWGSNRNTFFPFFQFYLETGPSSKPSPVSPCPLHELQTTSDVEHPLLMYNFQQEVDLGGHTLSITIDIISIHEFAFNIWTYW
jgi:hypothetical protein